MLDDENQIRDILQTWMRSIQEKNPDLIIDMMAEDVVFLRTGDETHGRNAYLESVQAMKNVQIEIHNEIHEIIVSGDLAYSWSRLNITVSLPGPFPSLLRNGNVITMFRKISGSWCIYRDINLVKTD